MNDKELYDEIKRREQKEPTITLDEIIKEVMG